MYEIIIEDNNNVSITGKIIKNINSLDVNEFSFSMNINDKLFNSEIFTDKDIEYNKDITHIEFRNYSDEKINFLNLNKLPNVTNISFYDLKTNYIPSDIFELTNIKELTITTKIINFFELQKTKYTFNNVFFLDKLVNLEYLSLDCDVKEFPNSILSLKKLKTLIIRSDYMLHIPNELCNLENIFSISIDKFYPKILQHNNKMIIFDWKTPANLIIDYTGYHSFRNRSVEINIPEEITDLKILNCCYNSLNNLPFQIENLSIGINIFFPLNNLPVSLKTLKLYPQNMYLSQDYINDNIKLPFDCKLDCKINFSS
jgi:hypothetical protein